MKVALCSLLLSAGIGNGVLASGVATKLVDVDVRLMSWNVRMAADNPGTGEEFWSVRRHKVASELNYETAGRPEALLCFQEVLHTQLLDIESDLGDGWTRVGVGRDDGVNAGEFSPIFYRGSVWELEQNRTYWLSETPDVPSKGWDAALNRIVTFTQLRHKRTGAPFVFMCTHFDHVGQVARENSANLLGRLATEWQNSTNEGSFITPVFLGGDLNITPDNQAYKNLIAPGNMHDSRDIVPEALWHGNVDRTFTGFTDDPNGGRIDHLFVKDPTQLSFQSWGALQNRFDDGVFSSDHRPVVVDVRFTAEKQCRK